MYPASDARLPVSERRRARRLAVWNGAVWAIGNGLAGTTLIIAAATPDHWLWLAGAAVLWIAYAGLNICLPNLMLKLSPRDLNTSYIAAFEGIRGLCYAASTILGGVLVDCCRTWVFPLGIGAGLRLFTYLFLVGWVVRSLGALVLLLVIEPPVKEARH